MYVIWGKAKCGLCKKIVMVLELLGKEYDYLELDADFTEDEFTTKFPGKNQFPQVELNGKHLGDCQEAIEYLKEHRILT
jgi:glutaredoxin|tara:strand:+ start:7617 stop:7853 length:237 start_codon:yes stop_codon:yes gene_type:complete